ncbi:MAG: FKBP-type peptidyl-prolyl cis-trans isomerase [Bacteroidaceae bacterium]|jgi:FKBP-type peptidyl-prolyl cis-trans isomerase FklB|nr:FKBP-type peptidyl-prolyl cis-trans isomerase [Bacteroidaceae bacterium]MBQ5693658.1 FKBP-type peptidyl-prolyl cis-trans isomerase [Bacteroidaceae bacterium]MBQ5913132.1 FKBP-type peptidyl-prolyl cis-trans isomerase [Bacteroidaceae bacterium]
MKKISVIAAAFMALVMGSCSNGTPKAELKSDVDSLCYAIGMANSQGLKDYLVMRMGVDTTYLNEFIKGLNEGANAGDNKKMQAYFAGVQIGQQLSVQMVPGLNQELFGADSSLYVGQNNFVAGFVAGTIEDTVVMTMEDANLYAEKNMRQIKARQMEAQYGENKKAGEAFMAEIAKKEGVKQLEESGVYYEVITEGKGQIPADTSFVKVKYEGTLIDGTVFDGNLDAEKPMTFRCNQVIPGWTLALTHMPAGSKWKVYIPQEMAYGEREAGAVIKPYSTLVFIIDLVSVGK